MYATFIGRGSNLNSSVVQQFVSGVIWRSLPGESAISISD